MRSSDKLPGYLKWAPIPATGFAIAACWLGAKADKYGDSLMMKEVADTYSEQVDFLLGNIPVLEKETTGDRVADIILDKLSEFVKVRYLSCQLSSAYTRYRFEPLAGQKVSLVEKYSLDLQAKLKCQTAPVISLDTTINIDVPRSDRIFYDYDTNMTRPTGKIVGLIGRGVDGSCIACDFSQATTCHMFVGGCTGSGKTALIVSLVRSLVDWHTANQVRIAVIDTKGVDFGFFKDIEGYSWAPCANSLEDAIALLEKVSYEMDRRKEILSDAGCSDIDEYNEKTANNQLFYLFLIDDEVTDLSASGDKKIKEKSCYLLSKIAREGRAFGIRLIVGTQKPMAKLVPSEVRDNLAVKIAFATTTKAEGKLITGQMTPSHLLLGKGDGFFTTPGTGLIRFQSLLVCDRAQIAKDKPKLTPLPFPDPRLHPLSIEQQQIVINIWKQTKRKWKTISIVWGYSKAGRKGSASYEASIIFDNLINVHKTTAVDNRKKNS
ncbi:MAG: DNA translocase FtsK [Moorea sp. SIO3C2]|nr:DNA translocase FtsK [Moorena sp. SIO3C2]